MAHSTQHVLYLFVSLQLLNEAALVEEGVQALLGVVVAEVLKGCAGLALGQPGVLKARRVHDEQRAQGMLAGFQGPAAHRANTHTHTPTSEPPMLRVNILLITFAAYNP